MAAPKLRRRDAMLIIAGTSPTLSRTEMAISLRIQAAGVRAHGAACTARGEVREATRSLLVADALDARAAVYAAEEGRDDGA